MPLMLGTRRVLFGGRPFQPTDIAGLVLWLAADRISGLVNNDPVGTWSDLSGNANDATQGTAAKKPVYRVNQVGGYPAVLFDGVDDYLDIGGVTMDPAATGYTAFAVCSGASSVAGNRIFQQRDGTGTGRGFLYVVTNGANVQLESFLGGVALDSTANYTENTWLVYDVTWDRTTQAFRKNGAADGSNTPTAGSATGGWLLGIGKDLATGAWSGSITEVILYNRALSTAEMGQVERYLGRKYGIAALA